MSDWRACCKENGEDGREYSHWKYQYEYIGDDDFDYDEMYDWCLFNIEDLMGWHVRDYGVIFFSAESVAFFKLTWM